MPIIWSRHPKYALFGFVVLVATFYLLNPLAGRGLLRPQDFVYDPSLSGRLAMADRIYDKLLEDRKGLIKKFGPNPNNVAMFPPNEDPWPAYTVWDFFPAAYNCPHEIQRLGALGDGGKWVCGISRVSDKEDCVVYSFGINYESSFEAEILANTRYCEVWGYDFSVNSFGPEISKSNQHRAHFKSYKLAGTDREAYGDEPAQYTLATLMKQNGHKHIDILKVDVESWEFETLTALVKPYLEAGEPLPFGQLQLEIHVWHKTFPEYLKWWETLEAAGLRPFWTEPNLVYQNYNRGGSTNLAEYSFLNIKGNNIFIKDPKPNRKHEHM
ncbi:hypothetical protein Moror_5220 [Moniliophthora roreri MCA 2997]|uniref:Methyltransferase domain-containing protein n=2 Tax=Moniliophthora roreri TaxID=221103 RepID=V2WQS3_MONRO|nr:hypothetical protein Moror_5220 [Moniliophthora roreri MCA 2997]KAI3609767.1 hypothetical protein WG66_007586 [Moniliophthora roreri]